MDALELLADLDRRGVELVPAGDRLRYRPATALDPGLRAELAAHKAELLALLNEQNRDQTTIQGPEDLPADWRIDWEERAAIREYDGGQSREHAEAEALREIIAQMRRANVLP